MDINQLINTPEDLRDRNWENQFLKALTESNIDLLSDDAQYGPDGWPYLMAEISDGAAEPAQKVLKWLSQKGIGLVINPRKEYPDYILTFGMIWSFCETGYFFRESNVQSGQIDFSPGQKLHAGEPTESYLPKYVRQILKEFFRDQGIYQPKVLVMSSDKLNYDLAFSLESLGSPPEKEHAGIAEAISWFLPPHYSIVIVSSKGLPDFFEL